MAVKYVMSESLKVLLRRFGSIDMTVGQFAKFRPYAGEVEKPGEHLTCTLEDLESGEPALLVQISGDGKLRMENVLLPGEERDNLLGHWELPEDEFWYFEAFRPAISKLSVEAPNFLFEMGFLSLYATFEGYLADLLRSRLRRYPRLMGGRNQLTYEDIFSAFDKGEILERMVDREVRNLMFLPITGLLDGLRDKYGLASLGVEYDQAVQTAALMRNCLLHGSGICDKKLSAQDPRFEEGAPLNFSEVNLHEAAFAMRKLAYCADRADQGAPPPVKPW